MKMRNSAIAIIAAQAARLTAGRGEDLGDQETMSYETEDQAKQLLAYCRQRKFPPAEQLARKSAEIFGATFEPERWQQDGTQRASYEVFRAVAQALEPFREEDTDTEGAAQEAPAEKPETAKKTEAKAPDGSEDSAGEPAKPTADSKTKTTGKK
jgi:hypothetical protein